MIIMSSCCDFLVSGQLDSRRATRRWENRSASLGGKVNLRAQSGTSHSESFNSFESTSASTIYTTHDLASKALDDLNSHGICSFSLCTSNAIWILRRPLTSASASRGWWLWNKMERSIKFDITAFLYSPSSSHQERAFHVLTSFLGERNLTQHKNHGAHVRTSFPTLQSHHSHST